MAEQDGRINAVLDGSSKYDLKFAAKGCKLSLLAMSEGDNKHRGNLNGFFNLSSDGEFENGCFGIEVNDGVLGKLPLIVAIVNIINIVNPHDGAFNRASIYGDIVNSKTLFSELKFKGNAVEITGKGDYGGSI